MSWLDYADRDGGEFAYITHGNTIIGNSLIKQGGLSVDRYTASGSFLEFGNVSASELSLTLDNSEEWFDWEKGDAITVEIDRERQSESTPTADNYKVGTFIVDSIAKSLNTVKVVALDSMVHLDVDFDWNVQTYDITTVLGRVATLCGITFTQDISGLANYDIEVPQYQCTCRTLVSNIAEVMGSCAYFNGNNELTFGWYEAGTITDFTEAVRVSSNVSENSYKVVDIAIGTSQDPRVELVKNGNEWDVTMRLLMSNPIVARHGNSLLADIIAKCYIINTSLHGMEAVTLPYPSVEPFQVFAYIDTTKSLNYLVPITNRTYSLNRNMAIKSVFNPENLTISNAFTNAGRAIVGEIEETVEETKKHFFFTTDSGAHITEIANTYTEGNNILIDSDSVDVRQGEVVVASFGEHPQIGESDNTHIEMAFNSLKLIDKESNEFFVVEDLRNKQGVFTMTETFVGNGTKKDFNLTFLATDTDYTVTVDDVVAYPSKSTSKITFTTPPALNSEIVVTYDTESELVKAMTFGSRKSGSKKGAVSIAEGGNNEASGIYSHAEGYNTTASGGFSHAEGNNTIASGDYSHTEGLNTTASGLYSHAEGWGSSASRGAHAEGNNATASNFSHAEGSYTNASNNSHAEGYLTTASGAYSHAEGRDTTASGDCAHAEGYGTTAGGYSHAEGYGCEARGQGSHAQNEGTVAGANQTALGKYNIADTTNAVIIGNGSDNNNRSNALTIDWNGSVKTGTRTHNFGGSNFICGTTDTSDIILWGNSTIKVGVGVTNTQDNKQFYLQARTDELRLTNNTDSTTLWQIKPDSYLVGESISFTENYVYYVGHITNSSKSLDFFIPLPRSASGRTCTLSLNASNGLSVRLGAGGYLNGTQYINTTTSDYTITTSPSSLGVRVRITKSTAYSGAVNNMACSVAIAGTLTFS